MTGTEMIDRVERYRVAARKVIDSTAPFNVKCGTLIELAEMARAEEDRELVRWAEAVLWEEAAPFLGQRPTPAVPADAYGLRQLTMRAEGYEACPRCGSHLPTEIDVRRWAGIWRAWAEEVQARKGAVSDGR
jgi:hypothetical protein